MGAFTRVKHSVFDNFLIDATDFCLNFLSTSKLPHNIHSWLLPPQIQTHGAWKRKRWSFPSPPLPRSFSCAITKLGILRNPHYQKSAATVRELLISRRISKFWWNIVSERTAAISNLYRTLNRVSLFYQRIYLIGILFYDLDKTRVRSQPTSPDFPLLNSIITCAVLPRGAQKRIRSNYFPDRPCT